MEVETAQRQPQLSTPSATTKRRSPSLRRLLRSRWCQQSHA
ncbi:hypothetical protein I3843_02G148900 [Carya illinoinensis]|nr:hypothetical protein I3843_02G148900 [Carya illinoinensis]